MKGNLSFILPEEQDAFDIASHAFSVSSAIWQFKQFLRKELKYPKDETSDETLQKIEEIQEYFLEEFYRFDFDD